MFVEFLVQEPHSRKRRRFPVFLKQARGSFENGIDSSAFVVQKSEVFEKFMKTHPVGEVQLDYEPFDPRSADLFEKLLDFRNVYERGRQE